MDTTTTTSNDVNQQNDDNTSEGNNTPEVANADSTDTVDTDTADTTTTVDTAGNAEETAGPTKHATAADVEEAMRDVVDPELGINIVDLGLVYGATVDANNHATLDMTLTSAACPLTDVIEDQTAEALKPIVSGHTINWVWMPPWGPNMITDDGREMLRALGFNL